MVNFLLNPYWNDMMVNKSRLTVFYVVLAIILLSVLGLFVATLYSHKDVSKISTITRDGIITDIQKLSQLQSIAFSVDAVVTARKAGSWQKFWQDGQKGIFVVHGRVLAGVDLSKISSEMVQVAHHEDVNGKSVVHVTVSVPPSEVFAVYLDDIEVYDWQTGLFGVMDNDPKILSEAQLSAKNEVLQKACQGGVMMMAAHNATEQIKGLFMLTGVTVDVVSQGAGACQVPSKN